MLKFAIAVEVSHGLIFCCLGVFLRGSSPIQWLNGFGLARSNKIARGGDEGGCLLWCSLKMRYLKIFKITITFQGCKT